MLAESLAVVLRALRNTRKLPQERLHSSRSYAFTLEAGKSKKISLSKLCEISKGLEISPLALLVLCESLDAEQDSLVVLGKLKEEISQLRTLGLEEKIREEQQNSSSISKAKVRENTESKRDAVKRLKEDGMSRKNVAEKLGLSKSSVQRFWG